MSARRFALFAAFAFFAMFVAGNLIANSWFRGWRLDLTGNQLYTLSPGTRRVSRTASARSALTALQGR
jgi:ABC-2 type transport system permease protein